MKNVVSSSSQIILFILMTINVVIAGRVLVVAPVPLLSHQVVFRNLNQALLKRGHEITFMTPESMKDPSLTNYTEIDINFVPQILPVWIRKSLITNFNQFSKLEVDEHLYSVINTITEMFYDHPDVKRLCAPDSKEKFDLVIVEQLVGFGVSAISYILEAPLIGVISTDLHMYHNYLLGAPLLPSHLSNWEFFYRISPRMSFWDRVQNYVLATLTIYGWYNHETVTLEGIVRRAIGRDIPPLYDIAMNMSLLMVNHDTVLGYARPLPPNVILFSGLHLEKKPPPLPKEMGEFLGNATEGFIYMSLGFTVKSETLPPHVLKMIHKVFSKLPFKILWKYEADDMPKSDNIFIRQWIPQQSVLSHPNIKLFIFQGGVQSTEETVYHGVPIVGMPIIFEQTYRIRKLVSVGVGRMVDVEKFDEETFHEAIVDVLNNKSYKTNMMELRKLTKDKPYDAKEHMVWWVEYIMRNKRAQHLRFSGMGDLWYQRYDMDVIAFLAIILFSATIVCIIAFVRVLRWLLMPQEKKKIE